MNKKNSNKFNIKPENIVADSHVGLIRECNEDSYVYCVEDNTRNALIAVADGIGGHEGGDIASRTCMQILATQWRNNNYSQISSKAKLKTFFKKEILKANKEIFDINQAYNIQHPMGTTIVAAILSPETILIAHAGDSRCYRLRNGVLTQLTEDHSYVAELVRNNLISLEEARDHPFSHIISKSIGPTEDVEVEFNTYERKIGDCYLLCSDGLNAHLNDIEIETILYDNKDPQSAVRELLYSTLRSGGEDNITVICVYA